MQAPGEFSSSAVPVKSGLRPRGADEHGGIGQTVRSWSGIMPGMPSAPGHDQLAGPAAAGRSRAGQVAVVTGGSAGFGLAIAAALAETGTTVVLASRSPERCAAAAERLSASTGAAVHGRPATLPMRPASAGSSRRSWPIMAAWMCW